MSIDLNPVPISGITLLMPYRGICISINNLKENDPSGLIKENNDKRSDKMISGYA
jgi:hypothetical protein